MKNKSHLARLIVVAGIFGLIALVLIWRIYDLTIMNRKFLLGQGDARSMRVVDIPAYRGMIVDREGIPLAVSTPVKSVWVNPKEFSPSIRQLKQLSDLLDIPYKILSKRVAAAKKREFIYLQRQIPPHLAVKIEALHIAGVHFREEFKRYYPEGNSIAQLIGFTNIDDNGIEGLELAYQYWLMGVPGKRRVVKDRLGHVIEELNIIQEPRPGNALQLSVDRRIQFFAYHELQNTITQFGAKSGSVVVLDTKTGEVLAVANYPSFNPNLRGNYTLDSYRNKAFTDIFEPGSVIKPFSIASALESGQFTPETIIDTQPSYMMVHGRMIRDIHNYGVLDVVGVLQKSSNVGVTKMVLASPPEQLYGLLTKIGVSQRTESGYPGESDGTLVRLADVNPFVLATLGFGYGMSMSTIQLAKSYLIFANEGRLLPITLLKHPAHEQGQQVLNAKTAHEVLAMMEAVVKDGTGISAEVPGYRVAGKTGTARVASHRGYAANRHIASFVGIAPASNPQLVVAVVIHEPTKGGYYAASVAAPLFAKVMGAALRILDVSPDAPKEEA